MPSWGYVRTPISAGPLAEANVYQTMMRDYRLRDREAEFLAALAEARRLADALVGIRPDADLGRSAGRGERVPDDDARLPPARPRGRVPGGARRGPAPGRCPRGDTSGRRSRPVRWPRRTCTRR